MPEMHFTIGWPDGGHLICYSPSLIVQDYLSAGQSYPVDEFLRRVGEALAIASERVRAKYGFSCSRAMDQWAEIQAHAEQFKPHHLNHVQVLHFS